MSTPVILLDVLKDFVTEAEKDILMPTKPTPKTRSVLRPPEVWKMRVPDRDSETSKIPYIILQLLNGADLQDEGQRQHSQCNVRIIAGAYSENDSEGAMYVLNMLERLRGRLLSQRVIGKQFTLLMPLEYLVYPDTETAPFFFGEMMTTWQLPTIKREVPELWQDERNLPNRPNIDLNREIPSTK